MHGYRPQAKISLWCQAWWTIQINHYWPHWIDSFKADYGFRGLYWPLMSELNWRFTIHNFFVSKSSDMPFLLQKFKYGTLGNSFWKRCPEAARKFISTWFTSVRKTFFFSFGLILSYYMHGELIKTCREKYEEKNNLIKTKFPT